MDKEIKEMTLGEKESFKYLDIDEVRKLSFFDFVSYCEGVMSDIANHPDCEICRGKDDYIALKSIEDVYIPYCLKKVYEDSRYSVIGFKFDFELPINDADWVKSVKRVGSIVLDSERTGYIIKDIEGHRIPFCFVGVVGVVLHELLLKIGVFYENKYNVIESDID